MNIAKASVGKRGSEQDGSARLERWEYGNPEEVAARRQAQSCQGCRHVQTIRIVSQEVQYCGKGRKHGRRCGLYQPEGI